MLVVGKMNTDVAPIYGTSALNDVVSAPQEHVLVAVPS